MRQRNVLTIGMGLLVSVLMADAASAYYSPRLGRFLNRDPIAEPGAVLVRQAARPATSFIPRDPIDGERANGNVYRFVDNNPIIYVDPYGLWKIERNGEPRAVVTSEQGDTIQTLAELVKLEPSEYKLWLKAMNDGIPQSSTAKIGADCKYTVPNTAYVHLGHIKVGWKFWAKGGDAADLWWAVMEWKDIASDFRNQGYFVSDIRGATKAVVLSHLGNENIAAWAIVAHGAEGIIWAADAAENDDELVGISSYDGTSSQHHKLSTVILYVCEAKKSKNWENMISQFGTIWWTEGKVRMWHDWDDLGN
ncbi:MAG TPA: hypothetical protein PLL20_13965 [Phycisphaerae bacterium]|nr:hypothetical protein [Phycisphaerae bacterium]HRR86016.1 hypothetical protein [Phycisphaerae bacterium]